jgi:tRNA-uridine 2-sulfurtransferase
VNWIDAAPISPRRVTAQIRHRHQAAPGSVTLANGGDDTATATFTFDSPQLAIAPGQAVVFYDGDAVVGGGWID